MITETRRNTAELARKRIEGVIAFLKEMHQESDLRFEPEDPFAVAITDLRNAIDLTNAAEDRARCAVEVASRLRAERDEARRMYLDEVCLREYGDVRARIEEAGARGWSYLFADEGKHERDA